MNTAEFLQLHPVFNLEEAQAALGLNARAVQERLKYHAQKGRVGSVVRGVYASLPPGLDAKRFRPDPVLVAAALRLDAVFSHHTALELLGAAHSAWSSVTAYTARRRPTIKLDGSQLRFVEYPVALVRAGKEHLGVREVQRADRRLQVTGPERTLVDGFRRPALTGGLAELVESAAGFAVLDLVLLRKVLQAYGTKSLWAAVGWFLERYQKTFYVPNEYLEDLEHLCPKAPHYLERGQRGGELYSRWNLILPEALGRAREPNET